MQSIKSHYEFMSFCGRYTVSLCYFHQLVFGKRMLVCKVPFTLESGGGELHVAGLRAAFDGSDEC